MPQLSPFAAVSHTKRDEDRVTWGLLLIYVLSTVYGRLGLGTQPAAPRNNALATPSRHMQHASTPAPLGAMS